MSVIKLSIATIVICVAAFVGVVFLAIVGTPESSAQDDCPTRSIAPLNLGEGEIPQALMPIYKAAEAEYDVPWSVLAAINKIETGFGTNLSNSTAGAQGWMQFMPATWIAYGVDANGDGRKDPNNPEDAIFAAANYLSASGAPEQMYKAVFAYNHADWYVNDVLALARKYDRSFTLVGGAAAGFGTCKPQDEIPIGNADFESIVAAANALDKMRISYVYGGGHVTPAKPNPGLDCSSSVSWVLQHAGIEVPTMTSGSFMSWGEPGPGRLVTLYTNVGHIIMRIGNRYFGTSGFGHPEAGTGPAWFTRPVSKAYLSTFVQRHPPGL